LPYVGTYIIAVSKAESQPNWINDAKAGRDANYEIDLKPGDGKRLTLEEIKAATGRAPAAAAGTAKLSAEEKARLEEMERKNAEIAAANTKNRNANEVVARTFKAGNDALGAKNYDEAIKQYEEGLAADPQQPALLTNAGAAYKARGVARYNAGVKAKDDAAKTSGIDSAKADFKAATEATNKAVAMIKSMPAPTDSAALANYNGNKLAAATQNADAMRLLVTKVDPTQADAAYAAYQDLIALETDPAKKQKAQLDATLMLLDAGASDKALQSAQKILETDPDNVEALRLAGLALFQSGDKAKFQEAANYLQRFVDKAPDSHPDKQSAKESLDYLKTAENVKPVKTTPVTTTRRGGKKP
jgi:tetratricopeptide (TPR) repeat protein